MGGYSATSDLDLGKKLEILEFWDGEGGGGVFCNFGFGLRGKSWKFGVLGWGGILQLRIWTEGKKLEIWIFGIGEGGYSATTDLDLGKKVGNLDFWDGGVFCNFGFGLREKSWKFGFLGWGVFCNFGFGLREKSRKFGFSGWGGILQLWIWT